MNVLTDTVPVVTLTGFLGSGKSTLLNALLGSGALPPTAIIVNEFGEIPLDHRLIESVTDGIALLRSGCVCCAVRSDLEYTLRDLYLKRIRGVIPNFAAVLLETSGLADPGPVLQTLFAHSAREFRYRVGPVVATVDCVHAEGTLLAYRESVRQVAVADRLILTKVDLCTTEQRVVVEKRLECVNRFSPRITVIKGNAKPSVVLGDWIDSIGNMNHDARAPMLFEQGAFESVLDPRSLTPAGLGIGHSVGIRALSCRFGEPLDWDELSRAVADLLAGHGDRILRMKGIVDLSGVERPVVIHAVHHTAYPPEQLREWASSRRESCIVFIVDGLDQSVIDRAMGCVAARSERGQLGERARVDQAGQ